MKDLKKNLEHVHGESCAHGHHHHHEDEDEDQEHFRQLTVAEHRCIYALEKLQRERVMLEASFREELAALERVYEAKYNTLNVERALLVKGEREPTTEELTDFSAVTEIDEQGKEVANDQTSKGIKDFWLTALTNHPDLQQMITNPDAAALRHLVDLRLRLPAEGFGFTLEFEFEPNDFFTNSLLTKEYVLENPKDGEQRELVFDHATGTKIEWKAGQNLCFKQVTKVQRHVRKNTTRTVRHDEPQPSFFHFFSPPSVPSQGSDDEDEEEDEGAEELEERLQIDFAVGEVLRDHIIPNAVDWFTGKALQYTEFESNDENDFDDEDDDEDDEEEEESDDDIPKKSRGNVRPRHAHGQQGRSSDAPMKPECKQQ